MDSNTGQTGSPTNEIMQCLDPKLSGLLQNLSGDVDRTLENAFRRLWTKREDAIIHQVARILTPKYQHELGLDAEEYDPDLITLQLEQQLRQAIETRPRRKGRPPRTENPLAQYLPNEEIIETPGDTVATATYKQSQ